MPRALEYCRIPEFPPKSGYEVFPRSIGQRAPAAEATDVELQSAGSFLAAQRENVIVAKARGPYGMARSELLEPHVCSRFARCSQAEGARAVQSRWRLRVKCDAAAPDGIATQAHNASQGDSYVAGSMPSHTDPSPDHGTAKQSGPDPSAAPLHSVGG